MPRVVGVDGYSGGWIGVVLDDGEPWCRRYETITELLRDQENAAVVAVVIPIGPCDAKARAADVEARRFAGAASSRCRRAPCSK